jgi:hypothetical protein
MRDETTGKLMVMFLLLYCSTCLAQSKPVESVARQQIDAGNQLGLCPKRAAGTKSVLLPAVFLRIHEGCLKARRMFRSLEPGPTPSPSQDQ